MYIGIDLGTSGIKAVLTSTTGEIIAQATAGLDCSHLHPLHSEQHPQDWVNALHLVMADLQQQQSLAQVRSIGLSGQMHGAVLLDVQGHVLRPAILWNDGRSFAECEELSTHTTDALNITGNLIMPGFTAPKLLWVKTHEPDIFAQIDKVLLPKDFLRYILSGEYVTEMSDASGTMWLDVAKRRWSKGMLAATGLSEKHMPTLCEGSEISTQVTPELCTKWGLPAIVNIAGGGGDNAAGAVGIGLVEPGQAMLSLGTSGVYFVVTDTYSSAPREAVHSFCHALPNTWHLMSVMLSAASCADWLCKSIINTDINTMFEQLDQRTDYTPSNLLFLPYLSGERTPHNDPDAKGVFIGLTQSTTYLDMFQAVLEGVTFAFKDGFDAIHEVAPEVDEINIIGGGAKSPYWRQLIANVLQTSVIYRAGSEAGAALGAARLAILADTDASVNGVCASPAELDRHTPDSALNTQYQQKYTLYQQLYTQLYPIFKQL